MLEPFFTRHTDFYEDEVRLRLFFVSGTHPHKFINSFFIIPNVDVAMKYNILAKENQH